MTGDRKKWKCKPRITKTASQSKVLLTAMTCPYQLTLTVLFHSSGLMLMKKTSELKFISLVKYGNLKLMLSFQ